MEFKIKDLEYALERYLNVVGEIEDNSKRDNTNKRYAFINAFATDASIHDLRELFKLKDANNIRYAIKCHDERFMTFLGYCDNFNVAQAIKNRMKSDKVLYGKHDQNVLEEA